MYSGFDEKTDFSTVDFSLKWNEWLIRTLSPSNETNVEYGVTISCKDPVCMHSYYNKKENVSA